MTNQERLAALRAAAMEERDPTCSDDVLSVLLNEAERVGAKHILEIGTGRGLTSVALLLQSDACVTTIERDQARIAAARENFDLFGVADRVTLLEGDAADILPCLKDAYDLIFLDAAKVQYRRFLPECKRLLHASGVLCADDVLLFSSGVPKKRKMLAQHIEEFLHDLQADEAFTMTILPVGKGLAVARKECAS